MRPRVRHGCPFECTGLPFTKSPHRQLAGLAQELELLGLHAVLDPAKKLGMNAGKREN